MEWKSEIYNHDLKSFNLIINNFNAIKIICHKDFKSSWRIEISGRTCKNYTFKWYGRFNKDKIFKQVFEEIKFNEKAKLAVFNRLFEGKK